MQSSYTSNATSISKHSFFPLIHRTIFEKRYKIVGKDTQDKPIRKHYIKENGKRKSTVKARQIYYADHLDAHIYSYYTHKILTPPYENLLLENSKLNQAVIGYRRIDVVGENRRKCNIDFANEVFETIKELKGEHTVFAFDISQFFDSLDHKRIKQAWCSLLGRKDLPEDHYKVYRSLVNFAYLELNDLLTEFGYKHFNQLFQKDVKQFLSSGAQFRVRIK